MAGNNQTDNFSNRMLVEIESVGEDPRNGNSFAWSHKKKIVQKPIQKKNKYHDDAFVYHPVTDFKENEDVVAVEPEKRINPARPESLLKPLQYTKNETRNRDNPREENISSANKNFSGYNFSGKDLTSSDFSGANLKGVDFSGANLSNVDFSNADLTGAVFDGAILNNANFYKAKMHNVSLHNADIENAILLEADIDNLTIEELQELIEFLATNFPHKVNLAKMNLFMLDLKRIDLKKLNLRGVDFTGIDFTGINIFDLDLSECIITPQQIAQALGRVPTPLELKRILAPKKKKNKGRMGIDFTEFFLGHNREVGVDDATRSFSSMDKLLETGKRVVNAIAPKPNVKDEDILDQFEQKHAREQNRHNEDLRRAIEENKRAVLEQRKLEKEMAEEKEVEQERESIEERTQKAKQIIRQEREIAEKKKSIDMAIMQRSQHERA